MLDLSYDEADRVLAALESQRQAAIDQGDLDTVQRVDNRMQAIHRALDAPGDRVRFPAERSSTAHAPLRANSHSNTGPRKDKITAGLLALLLGGLGVHKFYLGKTGMGIVYLLFFWTAIPAIIAFFEAIIYFMADERTFARKYSA